MKTLDEFKKYYKGCSTEEIIEDCYIDFCRVIDLQQENEQLKAELEKTNKFYALRVRCFKSIIKNCI